MTDSIKRQFGHKNLIGNHRAQTWILSDYYCSDCGKKMLWVEDTGGGDYHYGETTFCSSCKRMGHEPVTHQITNKELLAILTKELEVS